MIEQAVEEDVVVDNKLVCYGCGEKVLKLFIHQTPLGNKEWKVEYICPLCWDKRVNKPNRAQRRHPVKDRRVHTHGSVL